MRVDFLYIAIIIGLLIALLISFKKVINKESNSIELQLKYDSLSIQNDSIKINLIVLDSLINALPETNKIKQYYNEKRITDFSISNDSLHRVLSN